MTESATNFYVYMLFRLNGMPCYVGKGKGERWARHQGRKTNSNRHLGSIIDQARAAGKELPKVKVAEDLSEESAFEIERLLIGCIGREDDGPLVNLTDGGDGTAGYKPSLDLIARQVEARRGKLHPPGSNEKRSAGLKGKPKTADHIAAAAAGQRGKPKKSGWWSTPEGRVKHAANNPGHKGHKHSEETKTVIRAKRALQTNVSTIATQFKKGNTAAAKKPFATEGETNVE